MNLFGKGMLFNVKVNAINPFEIFCSVWYALRKFHYRLEYNLME